MLADRVMALRRANIFEAHRYRHLVGPVRIAAVEGGVAEARSNFFAVRIMHDGDSRACSPPAAISIGSTSAASPFRFIERTVVLDSQKIDTLLVIPLYASDGPPA